LPVGSSIPLKSDVRIIAATNKNLEEEMKKGKFRQDLYYRLSIFPLKIPALKHRKEDIPKLIDFFYEKWSESYKRTAPKPTIEMKKLLMEKEWQGNVRELENLMARYVLYSGNIQEILQTTHKKSSERNDEDKQLYFELGKQTLKEMETKIIKKALKYANGNKKTASELLGISERTIYRKITEDEE
jgi:transcriptional regulator with PAS, ATPase and Fis domain